MARLEHTDMAQTAAAMTLALGAALLPATAQADCIPAPGAFELCALDNIPDGPAAPEEGTLVLQLDDLWVDMSVVPEDFDGMTQDEILDLLIMLEAENARESDSAEIAEHSRTGFETGEVSGTTVVMQEATGDAYVMSVATHDTGRLFLFLHGDGTEEVGALEQSMQSVLASLRPRSVN